MLVNEVAALPRAPAAAPTTPPDPVLVIHGTFANPPRAAEAGPLWWEPGGEFCRNLDAALERLGANARCWAGLEREPFSWTGDNLEVARRAAARDLATRLQRLEADTRVARYHLVAHSHGGHIVRLALRTIASTAKLGSVVYLGTPFLHFAAEPDEPGTVGRINWFYVLTAIVVGTGAWTTSNWLWLVVAVTLLKSIVDYYLETEPSRTPARGGVLLRLPNDEAIQLLRYAAPVLSDRSYRRRAVGALFSEQGPRRTYAAADYVPWVSRQALDGWRRFERMRGSGHIGNVFVAYGVLLTFIPTLLFWLVVFLLKPALFLLDGARRSALRVAIDRGMKAAATMVYGVNVRGLKFLPGESCRTPYGIFDCVVPPEATRRIEEDLARRDPALLRQIRAALVMPAPEALAARLREVFTSVALLHAQYYAHPGMIEACARALQVDRMVWHRLKQQELWSSIKDTPAASSVIGTWLGTSSMRLPQESVPELFGMDSAAWSEVGPSGDASAVRPEGPACSR